MSGQAPVDYLQAAGKTCSGTDQESKAQKHLTSSETDQESRALKYLTCIISSLKYIMLATKQTFISENNAEILSSLLSFHGDGDVYIIIYYMLSGSFLVPTLISYFRVYGNVQELPKFI